MYVKLKSFKEAAALDYDLARSEKSKNPPRLYHVPKLLWHRELCPTPYFFHKSKSTHKHYVNPITNKPSHIGRPVNPPPTLFAHLLGTSLVTKGGRSIPVLYASVTALTGKEHPLPAYFIDEVIDASDIELKMLYEYFTKLSEAQESWKAAIRKRFKKKEVKE